MSLSTICDELVRVINRHISPLMSTSCVTRVLVKTVLLSSIRHVHDIHGEISIGSCESVGVYRTPVRVLPCVYENLTMFQPHFYELL